MSKVSINIAFPESMHQRLREMAKGLGTSIRGLVVRFSKDGLDREDLLNAEVRRSKEAS